MRIFGKGKCKFITNFSAAMVTSLPSHSLSFSLSHRKYLTHNIGSASALPIIAAQISAPVLSAPPGSARGKEPLERCSNCSGNDRTGRIAYWNAQPGRSI